MLPLHKTDYYFGKFWNACRTADEMAANLGPIEPEQIVSLLADEIITFELTGAPGRDLGYIHTRYGPSGGACWALNGIHQTFIKHKVRLPDGKLVHLVLFEESGYHIHTADPYYTYGGLDRKGEPFRYKGVTLELFIDEERGVNAYWTEEYTFMLNPALKGYVRAMELEILADPYMSIDDDPFDEPKWGEYAAVGARIRLLDAHPGVTLVYHELYSAEAMHNALLAAIDNEAYAAVRGRLNPLVNAASREHIE